MKAKPNSARKGLSSDDRCAVDVLLEARSEGNGALENCFNKSSASLHKHLKAAEQLFHMIGQMPVSEPPPNLVARTLKFIKKHEHDVMKQPAEQRIMPPAQTGQGQRAH
jgi:hypothetical protein